MSDCGHKNKKKTTGYCSSCAEGNRRRSDPEYKSKIKALNKRWYDNNKDKVYAIYLVATYGLTIDTYNRMYELQGGLCAMCKEAKIEVVDHSHDSGMVRALLCRRCNVALGYFEDEVLVRNAEAYLSEGDWD